MFECDRRKSNHSEAQAYSKGFSERYQMIRVYYTLKNLIKRKLFVKGKRITPTLTIIQKVQLGQDHQIRSIIL